MNRATLASRVRALLSKTVENGATEAEAMSAAEKARELMDRYHLDHGALGMEEEGTERYDRSHDRTEKDQYHIKVELMTPISRFTDTRSWMNSGAQRITYFGLKSDVDFASWLSESLTSFIINQQAAYHLDCVLFGKGELTRGGERSFITGAIESISKRLFESAKARTGEATGRSLIPLKNQIVTREYEKLGIHLYYGRGGGFVGSKADAGALAAGRSAGNSASFGRPVGGTRISGLLK